MTTKPKYHAMTEESLHCAVCDYIRLQYPKAMFNTDLSGIRLTPGLAAKVSRLRSHKGFPDIMIMEPRGKYYGLFLELKKEGTKLFNRQNQYKTDHLKQQAEVHFELISRGYVADFAIGFDHAKRIIDWYMKLK